MKKQIWCKSELTESIKHEYDVVETKNQYYLKLTTLFNSESSEFGAGKEVASITEHGEGYTINVYGNEINIDYCDAEAVLALLSVVYDTTMEVRELIVKTKIN